jgi:hypothetical protein
MEKITSLNQIPKGKLKNVIHLVEEDLLYKIAINFANIEIGKKLPGMTWDDLPDTNSLWDYIHVGNSWEEFKDGIKFAVRDRLSEAGEDESAKIAAGFGELDEEIEVEPETTQFIKIEILPNSDDFKMFQKVVNVGIDSNLEGFTKSKFGGKADYPGKYRMDFHLSEVPLLIRRLGELYDETGDENIISWIDDINDYASNPEKFDESSSDSLANKHGMNAKPENLDEVTDQERYEDVVFLQGDEAEEALNILDNDGKEAALNYLAQWHSPGHGMGRNELPHGNSDETFEKDGYHMSWNSSLGYIGLVYDTEYQLAENASIENEPMYVEYIKDMKDEVPFEKDGKKYQFVWAKYPDGKKDIGVYSFSEDLVYGYNTFRKMHNIKQENSSRSYANLKGKNLKPETLKDKEHPQAIHEMRLLVRKALKENYGDLNPPDTEEPELRGPEKTPKKKVFKLVAGPYNPYTFFEGPNGELYILDAELGREDLEPYATIEYSGFEKDWDDDSGYFNNPTESEISNTSEAYENLVNVEVEENKLPIYTGKGSYEHNQGSDPYAMYSADSGIVDDIKKYLEKGYLKANASKIIDVLKKYNLA